MFVDNEIQVMNILNFLMYISKRLSRAISLKSFSSLFYRCVLHIGETDVYGRKGERNCNLISFQKSIVKKTPVPKAEV